MPSDFNLSIMHIAVILGIVYLISSFFIWLLLPQRLIAKKYPNLKTEKDEAEIEDNIRRTVTQALGGVGLAFGLFLTAWQIQSATDTTREQIESSKITAENQLLAQQFAKGIEHLGDKRETVKLGGIFTLEHVGEISIQYRAAIITTLETFVRANAEGANTIIRGGSAQATLAPEIQAAITTLEIFIRADAEGANTIIRGGSAQAAVAPEIQAALYVIGKLAFIGIPGKPGVPGITITNKNLPQVNLSNLVFDGSNFSKVNFSGAKLHYATLNNADLSSAVLSGAELRFAVLSGADLTDVTAIDSDFACATILDSNLIGADLTRSGFKNADLSGSTLNAAILENANLSETNLSDAFLTNSNLASAILRNAKLTRADLKNADLTGADLENADLSGADLRTAIGLTQSEIDKACGNNATQLDGDLKIRDCSAKEGAPSKCTQ